jgi:hypothetical protein
VSTTTPKLAAIITAHKDTPMGIIQNLEDQTVRPAHLLVGTSDWSGAINTKLPLHREPFPNHNDYGYRKRNRLLRMVEDEFVGFFNHDDSYELSYIERMLGTAVKEGADIVYCGWTRRDALKEITATLPAVFRPFESTLGAFIVRTSAMLEVGGFPVEVTDDLRMFMDYLCFKCEGRDAEIVTAAKGCGDARAIWALGRLGLKAVPVFQTLYHSNTPYKGIAKPMTWGR